MMSCETVVLYGVTREQQQLLFQAEVLAPKMEELSGAASRPAQLSGIENGR
jgi:hypothetical protein